MARLVVGAVGAVIGFYVGGPVGALQGFSLAYGVSGFLDPNAKVLGPKLADLKAPQANFGAPIPYLRGAPRLAGDYIWASEKREVATTSSQGKGGPGVDSTVFTYEMDVLIEIAINRCAGIRRVWSNGKLVWSNADDADAETVIASNETTSWRDMRFYDGAPDQLPDPTYEAAVGVGNAPAYRTRSTIFIEGLNLGGSGQLPILTFEVIAEPFDYVLAEQSRGYPAPGHGSSGAIGEGSMSFASGPMTMHVPAYDATRANVQVYVYNVEVNPPEIIRVYDIENNTDNVILGTTDVSCFMMSRSFGGDYVANLYFDDASDSNFDFNGVVGSTYRDRFAILGDDVIFGSQQVGDNKLYRCAKTGGVPLVVSAAIDRIQCIAISSDGFVYALSQSGVSLYKLDLATLTLQATIAMPATGETVWMVTCDGEDVYVRGFNFYQYNGTGWDLLAALSVTMRVNSIGDQPGSVIGGVLHMVDTSASGPPFSYQVWALARTIPQQTVSLAEVVSDLCVRTKQLTTSDFDVTALVPDIVRSLAITTVAPTRATLEGLMAWYLFEWAEADGLVAVKRGGASVVTIPYDDLGVSATGEAEPLPKKRLNDMEQVARVSVKYANMLNDSQDGLEQADRLVTDSSAEVIVEAACGFTPTEAKRLAEANTMDLAVALLQIGPIALGPKYSYLQVADPFVVTAQDGSTFRVRAQQQSINQGVISMDLVLDDASAISSTASTDVDYVSSSLLRVVAETVLAVLDIPLLRDLDDGLGQYIAIMPAGTKWSAARVDESSDDTNWGVVTTLSTSTIIGVATTTLGTFTGFGVFDDVSSVTVNVGDGTLSSYTKQNAIDGLAQPYLIGSEIVIACTATFVSAGVYTLSTFLRGMRGTEWAIPSHAASETVVVLQIPGMWKVDHELPDLDAVSYFRATSLGRTPETTGEAHTDTGVAMMPYAPRDIHVDWTVPATPTFSWRRRSRYASALFGTLALAEVSESYDIEIRNGLTLVESATVTTPEYTALANPTGYTFTVWQNSAVVGRGYPASLEL